MYIFFIPATFGELNLGRDYFEGDILLTQQQMDFIQASRNDLQSRDLLKDTRKLWSSAIVPFVIAEDLSRLNLCGNKIF